MFMKLNIFVGIVIAVAACAGGPDAVSAFAVEGSTIPREVVPTAETEPATWRYTLKPPPGEWTKPGYDDSGWKEGESGFGEKHCPGATVRTEWLTKEIWLRRDVTLDLPPKGELFLLMHHDEDAEVFINGVLAATLKGYVTEYVEVPILPAARAALKQGKNLIAVHCRQTVGGQSIDVGLVEKAAAK